VILAEAFDCHGLSQGLPELTAKVRHACSVLVRSFIQYLSSTCRPDAYQQCYNTEKFYSADIFHSVVLDTDAAIAAHSVFV